MGNPRRIPQPTGSCENLGDPCGSRTGYQYGCRGDLCRQANTEWHAPYRQRRRRTEITRLRQEVAHLQAQLAALTDSGPADGSS